MAIEVDANQVQRLLTEGRAQLVDVLPPREFEQEHLTGAINLPLRELNRQTASVLSRDRPLVVY